MSVAFVPSTVSISFFAMSHFTVMKFDPIHQNDELDKISGLL